MGAPTVQGLTPAEERIVRYFAEGNRSQVEAAQRAGISDPVAHAAKIFARPRVQSALNAALAAAGATPDKVSATYLRNLDAENPAHQLHAADSVARIMGELGDRDRDSDGARGSVTNFTVVVVQPAADAIKVIDAD